jgi:hypothetical protein
MGLRKLMGKSLKPKPGIKLIKENWSVYLGG